MPSKEQLINALVREYEFLCHDDFDPDNDPTPEEYRNQLKDFTIEELIIEASIDATFTLNEYIETWG